MNQFDITDYISCQAWVKLYGDFDRKQIPPSGVIFCPLEHIDEFFALCRRTSNKYILVSAYSDYGLHEQNIDHPNEDVWKVIRYIDWKTINKSRAGYINIPLGPCCDITLCNNNDSYGVKYYSFTKSTFTTIPPNIIKWFCTNVNINHTLIEQIPFGLNDEGNITNTMNSFVGKPKTKLLYVNFQPHTHERISLLNYYKTQPWATVKTNIPVEEFWKDISEHEFVLCPAGNGLDCYRTWETLYLGSTPILEDSVFSSHFDYLPILRRKNLFDLTKKGLKEAVEQKTSYDGEALKLSYWKNRIESAAQLLKNP